MREKINLVLLDAAQIELTEIALLHKALVGPNSARNVTDTIYSALERLTDHPQLGVVINDRELSILGYRKLICGNYLCFYRLIDDTIYVYHIADGRTEYKKLFRTLPSEANNASS